MLKPLSLLFAALLFAIAPAIAQQSAPAPEASSTPTQPTGPMAPNAVNPVKPTAESQAKAKNLYQIDCAMCHGDNGDGKTDLATSMSLTLDNWTDPKALAGRPDGELFDIIRSGKDKMPPEAEGRATNTEVWNLILYIRGFSKPQPLASGSAQK